MSILSKRIYPIAIAGGLSLVPLIGAAQGLSDVITTTDRAVTVVNTGVTIVFVLALLVFGWGVVKYITASGDPAKIKEARGFIWWGVIGMFVLASIFGIIKYIGSQLKIGQDQGTILIPGVTNPSR